EQRRQQVATLRDERATLVETIAAEVAHEVRYPLNFFRAMLRGAVRGPDGRVALDANDVAVGVEEINRLARLVSELSRVSRSDVRRAHVPVADVVARAEAVVRDLLRGRVLHIDVPSEGGLSCDPDKLTQLVVI